MIKTCKQCHGEYNARNPKSEYCSKSCKKRWENLQRGKPNGRDVDESVSGENPVHTLLGQVTKISTTADQCLRIQVDVPLERVKFDVLPYVNQTVVVGFVENGVEEDQEQETGNGADIFD